MSSPTHFWPIEICGAVTVCVKPDIRQMTSYVLLEQEDWFEDEMDFIRAFVTPDMNAFDIGANHGVYGLTIASRLTSGHVWAFEPTVAPGRLMAESIVLNGLSERMTWVHGGLSDHEGEGEISVSDNSETNSLHGPGNSTETIVLHALDAFIARERIDVPIDFVKLDAEGEEIRILAGGRDFFSRQSPLLMFELRHGNAVNHGLIEVVEALGYRIYRLVPGLDVLVEYTPEFKDGFLLNLFACKADLADRLSARGLLARPGDIEAASGAPLEDAWQERLFTLAFARPYEAAWRENAMLMPKEQHLALSSALLALDGSLPAARRFALLRDALASVTAIADAGKGDLSLWLLRLNLAHLIGERALSVGIARKLAALSPAAFAALKLPFLPPAARFHDRDFGDRFERLPDALLEFIEYRQSFSNYFGNPPLEHLAAQTGRPGHGLELDRRLILMARRRGKSLDISRQHPLFAPGRPNAEVWAVAGI